MLCEEQSSVCVCAYGGICVNRTHSSPPLQFVNHYVQRVCGLLAYCSVIVLCTIIQLECVFVKCGVRVLVCVNLC